MNHFSYVEKLLDGVEVVWFPISEVTERTTNIKWRETSESHQYIDLTSVNVDTKKIIETTEVKASNAPSRAQKLVKKDDVLFATTRPTQMRYCLIDEEYDGAVASTGYCVLRVKRDVILPKWILHLISSSDFKKYLEENQSGSAYPAISDAKVKDFSIPIPCPDNPEKSLAIQAEIVRILDAFTAMTTELTTELNMRKKQYNYYRDQLLSFEDGEVEWKTLEEVAHFANGKGHEKDISEDGKFIVVNSKFISTDGLVAKYSDSQICPLFKDDILLVMSDLPNGKALSKTFIVDEDERYTLNQRIGGITVKDKSEMLPKFLHYYLDRTPQLLKHDNGVDQTNLRKGQILEVKVPILPLQKQEHIVSILDKFDKLTKSLSEGLPHEIELRQKQYEYYRDLLLSFPKSEEVTA